MYLLKTESVKSVLLGKKYASSYKQNGSLYEIPAWHLARINSPSFKVQLSSTTF